MRKISKSQLDYAKKRKSLLQALLEHSQTIDPPEKGLTPIQVLIHYEINLLQKVLSLDGI